jgi:hypothetical protein
VYSPWRVYVCPHVGDDFLPNESSYGVPCPASHDLPIPHVPVDLRDPGRRRDRPPPADAVRVIGPHVFWAGFSTHIQFGIPTNPTDPGRGSGTIPM